MEFPFSKTIHIEKKDLPQTCSKFLLQISFIQIFFSPYISPFIAVIIIIDSPISFAKSFASVKSSLSLRTPYTSAEMERINNDKGSFQKNNIYIIFLKCL